MKSSLRKHHRTVQKPSKTKSKILIIDNDPVAGDLLRNYMGGEKGFVIVAAETGAEGIRKAAEEVPDLILLDFRLTDMSGLEVHEKLRQNPSTREIPVIYLSYFLTLRTIEQATVKGAKGFISKPFTLSGIYTKVTSVLSST